MNDLPPPLRHLAAQYNNLVEQFQTGHISADEAITNLAATTTTDVTGALWSISQAGQFLRSYPPGTDPQVADPSEFITDLADLPPQPAFPAPTDLFPNALDTPPHGPWAPTTQPHVGPTVPPAGVDTGRSILDDHPTPTPAIGGRVRDFITRNKMFVAILTIGTIAIVGALTLPDSDGATDLPTTPPVELPTTVETPEPTAPPVTAPVPSTLDAATVATTLQAGTPDQIQALFPAPLDPVTLLRTQALWAGIAQSNVTLTPGPAVAGEDGTITQVWDLTRDGEPAPTTSVTVTWVNNNNVTWLLATPPTF